MSSSFRRFEPRPCEPALAVERALKYDGQGTYVLGGGGYNLKQPDAAPFRPKNGRAYALDCSGFVTWCYRLPRTRPGFNRGPWATVANAINTDSIYEDATHDHELVTVESYPMLGDFIVYPGEWENGDRTGIGHVGIVVGVPAEWDPAMPQWKLLRVAHCSPSRAPLHWDTGIKVTDGGIWGPKKGRRASIFARVVP